MNQSVDRLLIAMAIIVLATLFVVGVRSCNAVDMSQAGVFDQPTEAE